MTEYMLPTSPPSPRTLNPAVTPPSRATCFLPRFRIHSPAIISTTTIYFHSFNASEISEFSWREEIKFLDDSISFSLRTERKVFDSSKLFHFSWRETRGKDTRLFSCCGPRHVARVGNYSYSLPGHKLVYRNNRIHPENISWKCADASRGRSRGREEKMENKVRDRNIWTGWLGGVSPSRTDNKVEVTIDVRVGDAVISDSFLGRYIPLVQSRAAIKPAAGVKKEGEGNGNRDGQVFLRGIYLNLSKTFIEPLYRDTLCF